VSSSAERVFDAALYDREALDDALAAFDDFAAVEASTEHSDGLERWVVTVTTSDGSDYPAELLASELANYALAQTINRRR